MITAEELAGLRKGGSRDDDILNDYKQFDPQSASDIDQLVKSGRKPSEILDDLVEFYKGGQESPKAEPKPTKGDRPWYAKMGRALQYGAANTISGIGSTANRAGYKDIGDTIKGVGASAAPADYESSGAKFQALSPSTWGEAPYALLEGAPGLAMDLGAGALGTLVGGPVGAAAAFTASNAGRNFGQNVDARVGGADKPATADDLKIAGAATGAEAILNRVGITPALGTIAKGAGMSALKQVPGQVAKAGMAEGAAGAVGDVVNQVGRTAGTEGGLRIDPNEVINGAALSAGTGAAVRTVRAAGDVNHAIKTRDVDQEAAARLAGRMGELGVDTSSPEASYKAVNATRTALDSNIAEQAKAVAPFIKSKGNDTDADSTRALLNETRKLITSNHIVSGDALSDLSARLDHFSEGQALVKLLQERQELNRLTDGGRLEATSSDGSTGFFRGGLTSVKGLEPFRDPMAALKSRIGVAAAGSAGVAGLATGAQLGAMAPIVGKVLAGQMALNGATHAVDNVMGTKNPAQNFRQRFGGLDTGEGAPAPSARQAVEADKARAKLSKLDQGIEGSEVQADKLAQREDAKVTKQTDKAWSEKAKQDAQAQKAEEARQAEMDRAFASQEVDPKTIQAQ